MGQTRRTLFDDHWTVHVGDDLAKPRRVVGKAGLSNSWSDLTTEERDQLGQGKSLVEVLGRAFQAVRLRPSSNDASWETISLPHDWKIKTKPDPHQTVADDYPHAWQGYFAPGVSYYRKLFAAPEFGANQRVSITFDGIAGFSEVWLNGFFIGQQESGYSPLTLEVTDILRSNSQEDNVLLVRVDSTEAEGWWYEGAGIYRHAWLDVYNDVHIVMDSLHVQDQKISATEASVLVTMEIKNDSSKSVEVSANITATHVGSNEISCEASVEKTLIPSGSTTILSTEMTIESPRLWQVGKGELYSLKAKLLHNASDIEDPQSTCGERTSTAMTTFGLRSIEWVDDGILVNGIWTKLYGANIHQDWAVFGVALPDRVVEQKLELCAEVGFNSIRTAHHAPTPELVDHADRMGLLLLLENRNFSTSSSALQNLRSMVRKYRSRPSVIIWSIENEELDFQGTPQGQKILQRLVREVKLLDPSRATIFGGVVAFENSAYYKGTDLVGMHYRTLFGVLDQAVSYHPDQYHVCDEEGLYPSTRGVYQYNRERAYAGSMSTTAEVMGDTVDPTANAALLPEGASFSGHIAADLTAAYSHPKTSGTFLWTALDYIGEPTPLRWPATTSSYGTRDLIGLPKDYYWLLRSILRRNEPLVHVFPHWTWPGQQGEKLPVRAYTNCEIVEFVVNGIVKARLSNNDSMVIIEEGLEYQPGELSAFGYIGGKLVAEHHQSTAGVPDRLILEADREVLAASGTDICLVRVAITDAKGRLIPNGDNEIQVSISGSGTIVGVHNADPSTAEFAAKSSSQAFNGFLGVYVRGRTESGTIELRATSEGLSTGTISLKVTESEKEHQVHTVKDEAHNRLYGRHIQHSLN